MKASYLWMIQICHLYWISTMTSSQGNLFLMLLKHFTKFPDAVWHNLSISQYWWVLGSLKLVWWWLHNVMENTSHTKYCEIVIFELYCICNIANHFEHVFHNIEIKTLGLGSRIQDAFFFFRIVKCISTVNIVSAQ